MTSHDSTLALTHNVEIIHNENRKTYKNRVLQDGIYYLAQLINGQSVNPINYIAVGDSDEPNRLGTATMGNERFRKEFTISYLNNVNPVFETFFTESEANFQWKELGLFAGGSSDQGSGRLIARVLVDEPKNDNVTISTSWEFRIANT
ncbi:hypothetical protein [Evansella halocellulosilytica]|uniref:hypothetical protein n=1 Tax=Evansella halocellulosilytica TaxID=2011013 RepID=UPI000BB7F033|nr:hypothetical protein [Evansella halocellulosilytica]